MIVGLKAENILFDEYGYCSISGFEHAFIEEDSEESECGYEENEE